MEFDDAEDAASAIDNMDEGELFGRTIRVNIAKPMKGKDGKYMKPVWADDDWLQKYAGKTLEGENSAAKGGVGLHERPKRRHVQNTCASFISRKDYRRASR